MASKKRRKVRKATVLSFFWASVRKLETRIREGDQMGLYKHLQADELEREVRPQLSAYIKDEGGIFLKDIERIRERWVRWFDTIFNAKSPKLDLSIAEGLDQCHKCLGHEAGAGRFHPLVGERKDCRTGWSLC